MPEPLNLTALVTGASSGIGRACAVALAKAGARLILAARREERLDSLSESLADGGAEVLTLELDVRSADAVETAVRSLPEEWESIDVLVNNAGLSKALDPVYANSVADVDVMVDTNVKGLLYVTRAVVPGMVARGAGHIVNIGSTAGHEVYPGGTVYCATKHAVGAITRGLKMDLHGTGVRVSSVDPGLVETEFSEVRFDGDRERAATVYRGMTPLTPEDVADAVLYCIRRPAHVNISEIILMPTDQSSSTMVHRDP
ncbi:MAG: SDR family NAD(P)-dependent oxidoreductase [Rhodothermales bacterium]|nr:SDR family NAD(P)-dependent oxidoreductase [Rhodothermales bacterium]